MYQVQPSLLSKTPDVARMAQYGIFVLLRTHHIVTRPRNRDQSVIKAAVILAETKDPCQWKSDEVKYQALVLPC